MSLTGQVAQWLEWPSQIGEVSADSICVAHVVLLLKMWVVV